MKDAPISGRTYGFRSQTALVLFALCLLAAPRPSLAQSQPASLFGEALDGPDVEGIRSALRAGADPNERYAGHGQSALGRVGIRVLLKGGQLRITAEEEKRITAALDVLFHAGARLKAWDETILHGPSISGAALVTKYLVERGANPNGSDGEGWTPLLLAVKYEQPQIVPILLAAGAKPLTPAVETQVRLVVAANKGDLIDLRHQLALGAKVNERTPTGETALTEAIEGGKFKGGNLLMVRELLYLGASPNLPGKLIGPTSPLHVAVFTNEPNFEADNGAAIVAELLRAGGNVSSTDSYQHRTPLHIAAQANNVKAVEILLKAGAKVMPRDDVGKTPLDLTEAGPVIQLLKAAGATEQ